MKTMFLAREIAQICRVTNASVLNWISTGKLQSYTTPGGRFRIPFEALDEFMRKRAALEPADMEDLYLVREVAKICRVAHNTVLNWINEGRLEAYTTPGGQYRILRGALDTFISARLPRLASGLLLVGAHAELLERLRTVVYARQLPTRVECAHDEFDIGWWMATMRPTHVALNETRDLKPLFARYAGLTDGDAPSVRVVALPVSDGEDELGEWLNGLNGIDLSDYSNGAVGANAGV